MILNRTEKKLATWSWTFHFVGVTVTLLIVAATVMLVIRPMEERVIQLQTQADELSAALAVEESVRSEHQQLTTERQVADGKIEQLLDRIPNVPRESDFLGQITTLADDVGLTIVDYRPGTATEQKGYKQMTLTLSSDGSYESVCRFLHQIHQLPRLSRVLALDIAPLAEAGQLDTCKMMMTLTIFFAPDSKLTVSRTGGEHV